MTTLISKITVATCGAVPARAKVGNKEVELLQVYGRLKGVALKRFPMDMNDPSKGSQDFTAIIGRIEAVNLETGEVFQSGVAYMPAGIHDALADMALAMPEDATVKFAFILCSYPASNPAGYSYRAKLLTENDTDEDFDEFRRSLPKPPVMIAHEAKEQKKIA